MSVELRKKNLATAVMAFQQGSLYQNGLNLFNALGYNTNRTIKLDDPSYKGFNHEYDVENVVGFNKKKVHDTDWKEVQFLFQLTAEEMIAQLPTFKPTVDRDQPASFIFFAIELIDDGYSRVKLADIARQVNKPFQMDVFVLFKYGNFITFSLIERRPHKKIGNRDVIDKVTHVYNINIAKPHAGHIHILNTFSFDNLALETKRKRIEGFKDLQTAWKKAISTQILNKEFYLEYSGLSKQLIRAIHPNQIQSKLAAHQGVLNLLNRIMFIYFVQKKEWLMKDENFMINFWNRYLDERKDDKSLFHEHWLNTIFFSAFNNKLWDAHKSLKHIPEDLQLAFTYFPYLNGGLFTFHKDYDNFILDDNHFYDIFQFFEKYIFTITEDTPYDVNLEINPELLGKMYEGMINATDLNDVDAENGIVYTERPEINFMVRRSLVEVLDKKLNGKNKSLDRTFIYHFIFDEPQEKLQLLRKTKVDIDKLRNAIATITACDPACGSGSMLLGLLTVQMEMLRVIDESLGNPHTDKEDFRIKKQLISECIYGVDVKEWAVRIAELRLWLYMIAEAEFSTDELRAEPLLPNLDFKLRQGNSLLPKFGDIDFTIEDLLKGKRKSAGAARELNNYIREKKAFIQNQADSKTTFEQLKEKEKAVFLDFIRELITEKEQGIHNRKVKQGALFVSAEQKDIFEEETEALKNEIERLKKLRSFIFRGKRLPFSYDIDFMEVFFAKEDDPGFDLIIGNPPYVRQEDILPPENAELLEELLKPKNKSKKAEVNKELKEALNKQVYKIYPFLNSKQTIKVKKLKEVKAAGKKVIKEIEIEEKIPVYGNKVPGRSDLYVYFQLICPHYLNSNGTFCFIISNSWLDVEFGGFIQHFLLKHTSLKAVYDCSVRSFDAAINTVIYLHDRIEFPRLQGGKSGIYKLVEPKDNVVKFCLNKIDFTQAAYSPLLIDQENVSENEFNEIFRCIPINCKYLFEQNFDNEEIRILNGKWGGKYLYAPEIYYTIIEKGIELKINSRLSKFFIGERYLNTGGADGFFILTKVSKVNNHTVSIENDKTEKGKNRFKGILERDYLRPLIKDFVKNNRLIEISGFDAYCLVVNDIKNLTINVKKYIQWGELNNYQNRSVTSMQNPWYKPTVQMKDGALVLVPRSFNDTFAIYLNPQKYLSLRYYRLHPKIEDYESLVGFLNSTVYILFQEVLGNKNLGEGALDFFMNDFLKMDIPIINKTEIKKPFEKLKSREIKNIFLELGFNIADNIRSQNPRPLPDRKALDDIIFDELGLTYDERNEVYWSVAELVKQRLDKAASR